MTWDTVIVAAIGFAANTMLAIGTLRAQHRQARLAHARSTRKAPYAAFGIAVEQLQIELDRAYDTGKSMQLDQGLLARLTRDLELSRVEMDLLGSASVRRWAYRASLALQGAISSLSDHSRQSYPHFRGKLEDARGAWVRAARAELDVASSAASDAKSRGGHDQWLEGPSNRELKEQAS